MLTAHVHLCDDARRGNAQLMAHVYMHDDVRHMIDVTNIYTSPRGERHTRLHIRMHCVDTLGSMYPSL